MSLLLKDVFDIDSFQSFFEKGGWFSINENLQGVLNALINLAFGLIKYVVLALDYVIEQLFSLNLLEGVLPDLFSTASSIYNQLFSVLGILLFTFVIVISVKDFFEKGITKALIRFGIFTLIYAGSMVFFSDGAAKVQEVNTISQNVQGQLVDLTSGSLNSSNQSTTEKLVGGGQQLDGTSNIRNLIFDEFIIKPYALLNFGKTDITKKQFELYLVKKGDSFDKEKTKEIEKKIKQDSEKNSYLTSDRMTEKVAVLLNTFVMLLVIGVAVLLISVANILIQLLIYGIVFLFPSLLFLALIPNMHHLIKNGFMMLGTLFASKVGIGFGFGLLFSTINLLDSFFVVTNIVTMLVGLFVKVLLGLFIWKNKGQIVRSLTKGKTELRDFTFPKSPTSKRQQKREQREDHQNRLAEQAYKTQTAENDYLRSGVELDRAYQQNDFKDNLLVQAGNEASSPGSVSFDTEAAKPTTESVNDSVKTEESSNLDSEDEVLSYSESELDTVSISPSEEQETILPVEEMAASFCQQQAVSEQDEQQLVCQNEENRDDQIETPRFTSEPQHQPIPVELEEAKELAKEMGELRQETYEEIDTIEESAYEAI